MANPPVVEGYEDLQEIGSGGFGAVYRATQSYVGQKVAIKVLSGLDVGDTRQRDRFLREGRAMSEVGNIPHIVPVFEAKLSVDGRPCLVMPFFGGGNLGDLLTRKGPLPVDRAVDIGRVIAEALGKVHRRGITHRDIKPENILLNEDGDVALGDFGLAVSDSTRLGRESGLMMTEAHASPERFQAPDGQVDDPVRSDVYSLASTIYTLIAGRPPFGTAAEVGSFPLMERVIKEPLPPITNQPVPLELTAILERAMAKRPEDRYETATELAEALQRVPSVPQPTAGPLPTMPAGPSPLPSSSGEAVNPPVAILPPTPDTAGSGPTVARGGGPAPADVPLQPGDAEPLMPSLGASTAPSGETVVRSTAVPTSPPAGTEERSDPRGRRTGAIVGGIAVGVLVVIVAVVALTRGGGSTASGTSDPSTTTTALPVGTVLQEAAPPVVETVRQLSTGDLSFTWQYAPGTDGQPAVGYEVLVDGERAGIGTADSATTGTGVNEQVITADDLGSTGPVDPATHTYCVKTFLVLETGTSERSPQVCLASP